MRLKIFEENSTTVDVLNKRFNDRGVKFADNQSSDLSKEERKIATGFVSKPQHDTRNLHAESQVVRPSVDEGRMLKTEIDWFDKGKVGPVKN